MVPDSPCHRFICLVLMLASFQCRSQDGYFPSGEWRTSSPASQGLNQTTLNDFVDRLRTGKLQPSITSFFLVVNGYLVVNEAFNGYDTEEPHTLQSVTKSITSTLVGVALQQGLIENLDQPVVDFFPEYTDIEHLNEDKRAMNLHDALTMRTGQAWTGERHLGALNRYQGDKMKYVLDYAMETSPGKKWYYNSGIAILLGGLLENATGMSTPDFAEEYLFEPIGIYHVRWRWGHRGIPHTGGGLFLTPDDMARIGYLYLRNGRWGGQQILPTWWVKEATHRHVLNADQFAGVSQISYGYMWWLMSIDKKAQTEGSAEIFMAYGHWGQFIFVIPQYDAVVVFTNNNSASYQEELHSISLLYDYVLPAISID